MNVSKITRRLHLLLSIDQTGPAILRSALAAASVRMGGLVLAFFSSVVCARILGVDGFGRYTYVMAVAGVLSVPAALGMPQYLVREVAGRVEWVEYLRRWADKRAVQAGCALAFIMLSVSFCVDASELRWLFALSAVVPLLTAVAEVRRGLLQGVGMVVLSQVAPLLFVPFIVLLGVLTLNHIFEDVQVWQVMLVTVVASAASLILSDVFLRAGRVIDSRVVSGMAPNVSIVSAVRFMWLGALYLLLSRTDLIMLGVLSSDEDVGVYAVSSRAADLVPLVLAASNMVIAPRIARFYREGRMEEMRKLLSSTMRLVLLGTLPVVLILLVGANWLLVFFYGEAFADGATVMRLLVLSQLVLVLGGPLGTVLEMTGNEKASLQVLMWVVALNAVLNVFLIPHFGSLGAASATCLSVVLGRILLFRKVRTLVSLRPKFFGAW